MIDLYNGQITDIMPDNLNTDYAVQAISFAIANMVKKIMNHADKSGIYAIIDDLEEDALDLLAVELRTKYYGDLLSLKEKREIIKKTLLWYYRAGTLYTVKELIDFIFEDAYAEEWFQYETEPYLFQIIINVISQDITIEKYMMFMEALREVKNTRSHLETVIFKYNTETEVKVVAVGGIGQEIKIKAKLGEKIKALSKDINATALFVSQDIRIAANNEITEKEVYAMDGTGKKEKILTENGSVVMIG